MKLKAPIYVASHLTQLGGRGSVGGWDTTRAIRGGVFHSRWHPSWHIEGPCDTQRTIFAGNVVRDYDPNVLDRRKY